MRRALATIVLLLGATVNADEATYDAARFPKTMSGQLDRIDAWLNSRHESETEVTRELRRASAYTGTRPIYGLYLVEVSKEREAREQGSVTYPMLKKNPPRYAGRAWGCYDGKVVEIVERAGSTVALLDCHGPVWVAGRFESDFVEGSRVDVVGFVAGEYRTRSGQTIPAVAAAAFFRAGGVDAMGRYVAKANAAARAAKR